MVSAIRYFYDGMRACVRRDDRMCSRWFALERGLRQGRILAPSLFDILFEAVTNLALYAFQGGQRHHGCFDAFRKKTAAGGEGEGGAAER